MNPGIKTGKAAIGPPKKEHTPKPVKGLLLLFISVFALLGIHLVPSTVAEGWLPTVSLLVALGLVTAALLEVIRTH
jgi:hypothetical protein